MLQFIVGFLFSFLTSTLGLPLDDSPLPCPDIAAQQNLHLNQILGSWRLAYIFFGKQSQSLDEEETCFVVDIASKNNSATLSLYVDLYKENVIERTTAAFPLRFESPAEWKVYLPFSDDDFIHGRVIGSSEEHMIVTFCGPDGGTGFDFGNAVNDARKETSDEETLDWKTLFEPTRRKKRSLHHHGTLLDRKSFEGPHLWTIILVKHNDISALKFVEYATVLMKHGFDVTQGELVSFGKCPAEKHVKPMLLRK